MTNLQSIDVNDVERYWKSRNLVNGLPDTVQAKRGERLPVVSLFGRLFVIVIKTNGWDPECGMDYDYEHERD